MMKKILCALIFASVLSGAFSQISLSSQTDFKSALNSFQNVTTNSDNSTSSDNKTSTQNSTNQALLTKTEDMFNLQFALSNPNYMVSAGDVYSLSYAAGTTPVEYKVVVDSSYKIRVSNLAVLDATGKTYINLKKQVEEIVSKNYPLSGVQFVLISPSVYKVPVIGCLTKASEQKAWPLTRLSEILEEAPLNDYSSTRFVDVRSASGKVTTYDLFQTKRNGDYSQNPYIRPGDTVIVKKALKKIMITGEVVFPDIYELTENENLKDLIYNYAGGLGNTADTSRIEISKMISQSTETGERQYLTSEDINNNHSIDNMDAIFIESYQNLKPRLYIEGAIYTVDATTRKTTTPSTSTSLYKTFEKGTSYDFFVRSNASWFGPESDIENAYILRNNEVIKLNIKKILEEADYYSKLIIVENDVLRIPFKQYFVCVAGSVLKPGLYPYIPDRTYEYYVGLAGGFIKKENVSKSVKIVGPKGEKMSKTEPITPETTITANTNSFLYYFNQVAPVITTILSIVSTTLLIKQRLE